MLSESREVKAGSHGAVAHMSQGHGSTSHAILIPFTHISRHIFMSEPVRPVAELEQPSSSRAQHAPLHVSTSPLNQRNDEETSPRSRGRRVRIGGMIRESLMSLGSRIPSPSYTLENTGSAGTFCVCARCIDSLANYNGLLFGPVANLV